MEDLLRYTVNWAKGSLGSRDDCRAHIDYVETRFAELCAGTPETPPHAGSDAVVQRVRMSGGAVVMHVRMYAEIMSAAPAATCEDDRSAAYTKVCKALRACDDTVVDPLLDWSCDWPNGVRPIASELIVRTGRCQTVGDFIGESYTGESFMCRNVQESARLPGTWPRYINYDSYYESEINEGKEKDNRGNSSSDVGYTQPGSELVKRLWIQVADRQDTTDGEAAGLECGDILPQTGAMKQLKHRRTC